MRRPLEERCLSISLSASLVLLLSTIVPVHQVDVRCRLFWRACTLQLAPAASLFLAAWRDALNVLTWRHQSTGSIHLLRGWPARPRPPSRRGDNLSLAG